MTTNRLVLTTDVTHSSPELLTPRTLITALTDSLVRQHHGYDDELPAGSVGVLRDHDGNRIGEWRIVGPDTPVSQLDPAGLGIARRFARWHIGDASWAGGILRAYFTPDIVAEELDREEHGDD